MKTCIYCFNEDSKRWYKGPKCQLCYSKEDYTKNKDRHDAKCSKYYARNREKVLARKKIWYYENQEQIKERNKKEQQTTKFKPNRRRTQAKSMAKERGLPWEISLVDYTKLIDRPCTYCNKPPHTESGGGLDRIDNNLGYLVDNVLPCCGSCNRIRGDNLTVDEMRVAIAAILAYRNNK